MKETGGGEILERIVWNFPGGSWGWVAAGVILLAVVAVSYCLTLRDMKIRQRLILIGLRLTGGALLLLCLADPRRVEETTTVVPPAKEKTLVLFDTSSSMTEAGLLGTSRLEDSLTLWRRVQADAGEVRLLRFDRAVAECDTPEQVAEAVANDPAVRPTHLAEALAEAAARADADGCQRLICFTDGIDTADQTAEGAAEAALAGTMAQVEIVGADTELAMQRYVSLARLEAPTQVLENARAPLTALVAYSNLTAADTLVAALSDAEGNEISQETVKHLGAGGTALFRAELPAAPTPGVRGFRLTLLLNDSVVDSAYWSVETVVRERKRILLYQGTYDWAARFFKNALGRNAERTELVVRTLGARQGPTEFPDATELSDFDAVFLLNLERSMITPAMEATLTEYLGQGGGVLFITGNPPAAAEFANSPIEALLPVEFAAAPDAGMRADKQTSRFSNEIEGYRNSVNDRAEALLISQKDDNFRPEPMSEFTLTPTGTASPIFRRPDGGVIVPCFLDNALVQTLKPGAQALATGPGPDGTARIVLAAQRYGRGRSAVLATDPLWRWRLALPSTSRDYDFFWENLAGWLGDAGKINSGGWKLDSVVFREGENMALRFRSSGTTAEESTALRFIAVGPEQAEYPLELQPGMAGNDWVGDFTPPSAGIWQLRGGDFPVQWFTVIARGGARELEQLAPDENFFRALAQNDNVRVHRLSALADDPQPLFKRDSDGALPGAVYLTESRATALWWRPELFVGWLIIYLAELLLRRKWRLV